MGALCDDLERCALEAAEDARNMGNLGDAISAFNAASDAMELADNFPEAASVSVLPQNPLGTEPVATATVPEQTVDMSHGAADEWPAAADVSSGSEPVRTSAALPGPGGGTAVQGVEDDWPEAV